MAAFIGQGFGEISESGSELLNQDRISSIGDAVEASLSNPSYTSATAVVAFATSKGVEHFSRMVQDGEMTTVSAYVGVDEDVTSRDALEEIHETDISGFVYHGKATYHPKLFYFEGESKVRAIVGSGNLTQDGLYSNYEAALVVDLDKENESDQAVISDLKEYLASIDGHGNRLSEEFIEQLASHGRIRTEREQRRDRVSSSEFGGENQESIEAPEYRAEIPQQSAPSLGPVGKSSEGEESAKDGVKLPDPDSYQLSRGEMPDIPRVTSFKTKTDREYYRQLISDNDNQVNFMRRTIREEGEITKGELKQRLRVERDANISGSFDADLRVLWRTTDEVDKEGRGDGMLLTWVGE